jgi:hypothetical protein
MCICINSYISGNWHSHVYASTAHFVPAMNISSSLTRPRIQGLVKRYCQVQVHVYARTGKGTSTLEDTVHEHVQ